MDAEIKRVLNHVAGESAAQACMLAAITRHLSASAEDIASMSDLFRDECTAQEANAVASAVTADFRKGFALQRDRLSVAIRLGRLGRPKKPGP